MLFLVQPSHRQQKIQLVQGQPGIHTPVGTKRTMAEEELELARLLTCGVKTLRFQANVVIDDADVAVAEHSFLRNKCC